MLEKIKALLLASSTTITDETVQLVLDRLKSLTFLDDDSDNDIIAFKIAYTMLEIENSIFNMCNIKNIPQGLMYVYVDVVCGKVILEAYRTKSLPSSFNLDEAFKSVKLGDIQVTEGGTDDATKLTAMCDYLIEHGKDELVCYRKIKW